MSSSSPTPTESPTARRSRCPPRTARHCGGCPNRLDAEADAARRRGELDAADVLLMLAARLTDRTTFPTAGLVVDTAAGRTLVVRDSVAAAAVHTGDIDAVATPMPTPGDPTSGEVGSAALAAWDVLGGVLDATPKGEPVGDEHLNDLLWAYEVLDRRDPWQARDADALHQAPSPTATAAVSTPSPRCSASPCPESPRHTGFLH